MHVNWTKTKKKEKKHARTYSRHCFCSTSSFFFPVWQTYLWLSGRGLYIWIDQHYRDTDQISSHHIINKIAHRHTTCTHYIYLKFRRSITVLLYRKELLITLWEVTNLFLKNNYSKHTFLLFPRLIYHISYYFKYRRTPLGGVYSIFYSLCLYQHFTIL